MLSRSAFLVMAIPAVLSQAAMGQQQIRLDIWAVDPLVKVFRDAAPVSSAEAFAEAAETMGVACAAGEDRAENDTQEGD